MAELGLGSPEPLGVTLAGEGVNIAIPAPGAEVVEFCLFDARGAEQLACHRLPGLTGDVHHGWIPGVEPGARYGLRAQGPWQPEAGHVFDAAKLLLDPWACAIDRPFALDAALFTRGADSAAAMPKAIVSAAMPTSPPPPRPGPRILYEMHVRGFTMLHPEIPEAQRGTFAGLAHPAAIAHLVRLGITHVELLPVAAGIDERHLPALGLRNYWNYNPVGLLAPDPRLAPGGMAEVREAVEALRKVGIGVILDVVFNHTGEGDALGPTLSLRGLGNASWYRLRVDGTPENDAGCGNVLALDRDWPLRLTMDALRHWVLAGGVDGFRLDLATTLGRRAEGFDPAAPLLLAMRQDPVLRDRIFIAEPWDLGPSGYRLGEFPAGWGEWNDRFRDDVRRFWRGDAVMRGALATRLAGSADLFPPPRRCARESINFVTAHDGFTLADLVSYDRKHNAANGEANRDGTTANLSWNCGIEGPTDDTNVLARRAGDVRALLATLLLARGTPMLAMGDEAGRTQSGNNNAYAQDNATSWLDWAAMDQGLIDYTAALIAVRRAHRALHDDAPLTGTPPPGTDLPDAAWFRLDGAPMAEVDWADARGRGLLLTLYAPPDRVAVAINGNDTAAQLVLPPPRPGHAWQVQVDRGAPGAALAPRSVRLLAEVARAGAASDDTAALQRLARAAGLTPAWHHLTGTEHRVPAGTLRYLLGALGLPAATQGDIDDALAQLSAPPLLPRQAGGLAHAAISLAVARPGLLDFTITLADGRTLRHLATGTPELAPQPDGRQRSLYRVTLPPLPPGHHQVTLEDTTCALTVAPPRCFALSARGFGIAAQLYALRRAGDQGIGDYTALAELARHGAAAGAMLIGISPPHALHPVERERASPYQPSDRRFLEPILIDVPGLPAAADTPLVDYPRVWAAKRAALLAEFQCLPRDEPGFAAFRLSGGAALQRFASFTAIAEQLGHTDRARWPAGLRDAEAPGVAAFAEANADAVGFQAFLQWRADAQLAAAARAGAPLYRDLAVGAAPDGAETWTAPGRFLAGVSVGAPPDAFAPQGQVWGLPALVPAEAPAAFAELLRANMRHAAALRIDHVMGLARLFVVPDGAGAGEGAYLHYPFTAMLRTLALESSAARCAVIGEDLGTVPLGFRAALADQGVLSYRVLWFEQAPPEQWPEQAAACVSTHDLPTLAGWWEGADLEERAALGLLPDVAAAAAERGQEKARLLAALGLPPQEALPAAAIHAHVARAPSQLLMLQAEELAGQREAVNLPGTDRERPNWRRRLPREVAAIFADETAQAILSAARRDPAASAD